MHNIIVKDILFNTNDRFAVVIIFFANNDIKPVIREQLTERIARVVSGALF